MDVDTASFAIDPEESVGNTIQPISLTRGPSENVDEHLLDVDWASHSGVV